MSGERSFDALDSAVDAVVTAHNIDRALVRMIDALNEQYDIGQSIVGMLNLERATVRIVAVWSAFETLNAPGVELSLRYTEDMAQLVGELLAGRPMVFDLSQFQLALLNDIFEHEGITLWVAIPLHRAPGRIAAVLGLGTAKPGGFTDRDVPFFTGLGRGIEEKFLDLVERSGR